MGTKIEANPHLREYHSFIDLDSNTRNAMKGNWALENGKKPDSLLPYDIVKVRQTILEHESTFRNQLRELHRVHRRQQELMNEIKSRGINKDVIVQEKSHLSYLLRPWNSCHSSSPPSRVLNNTLFPNLGFSAHPFITSVDKQQERFPKFAIETSQHGPTFNLQNSGPNNLNLVTKDLFHDKECKERPSGVFPRSLLSEPRNELPKRPIDIDTSLSRTKKKIFGVEISEGNAGVTGKWLEGDKNINTYFKNSDSKNEASEVLKKDLVPWFLRNTQDSRDFNNGTKSSYFMNLDSLQSCSKIFFGKSEMPNAKRVLEDSRGNGVCAKTVEADETGSTTHLETKGLVSDKGFTWTNSDLRHSIDLNLSLSEIDLEAPPLVCSEVDTESRNTRLPNQERDKIAGEALIAISLCVGKEFLSEFNTLKWFAEVVSNSSDTTTISMNESTSEEESIPKGMDYFEFTTLNLKEEHYFPEPFMSRNPSENDMGPTISRRSKRGRQRKDFQRDILPGLVTLSRVEVAEDFQAFEELMRAGGGMGISHRSSGRNGRVRRRPGAVKTHCSTQAKQPVCEAEERGLTGWGKKTRRLPRQRCPNAFLAFPVKC